MSLRKRLVYGISFFVISLTIILINVKPSPFQMGLMTITSLSTIFIINYKRGDT